MTSLGLAFTIFGLVISTLATPLNFLQHRTLAPRGGYNGTQPDGKFYTLWTDDSGSVNYTNTGDSQFAMSWQAGDHGNFIGGKGWFPGTNSRVINYSGVVNASGNNYLSVYGRATNPLKERSIVEYYILEHWGTFVPSTQTGLTAAGTLVSDGATYNIYHYTFVYGIIDGLSTVRQFWSIRQTKRTNGTVTFANHVDAWKKAGMVVGTHSYQVVAIEGYGGSGSASVTVG